MKNLNEIIQKSDTATLWALVGDVAELLTQREYEPDKTNSKYMFWYGKGT